MTGPETPNTGETPLPSLAGPPGSAIPCPSCRGNGMGKYVVSHTPYGDDIYEMGYSGPCVQCGGFGHIPTPNDKLRDAAQ